MFLSSHFSGSVRLKRAPPHGFTPLATVWLPIHYGSSSS
jgi:hypothetical protein